MAQINLNEQARQILKIAEEYGVEQNFFFITTFKRYQVQLQILNDLEKTIKGKKSFEADSFFEKLKDFALKTMELCKKKRELLSGISGELKDLSGI